MNVHRIHKFAFRLVIFLIGILFSFSVYGVEVYPGNSSKDGQFGETNGIRDGIHNSGKPAKILFLVAVNGPTSHFRTIAHIGLSLVLKGHSVSFIMPEQNMTSHHVKQYDSHFHFIPFKKESLHDFSLGKRVVHTHSKLFDGTLLTPALHILQMAVKYRRSCQEEVLKYITNVDLVTTINNENFDVIFVDGFWIWLLPLAGRLEKPYVVITTRLPSPYLRDMFKLPLSIHQFSFENETVGHDSQQVMPLPIRMVNVLVYMATKLFYAYASYGTLELQELFNIAPSKWPLQLFSESEIWFSGSDSTWDAPYSFFPNVLPVGGSSGTNVTLQDEEFISIMESSRSDTYGVIVVSMGSVVGSMPQDQVDAIASALAKFPHTVVWKEISPLPRFVGNNTIFKKWIPQQQLLAHSNTKIIVSHCGNNGAFEALYHGIPILGIPFFGDQKDVAYRAMSAGMGLVVERSHLAQREDFFNALKEILTNKKYSDRARFLSSVYRDMPERPADRAAFWVEYVYRHKGARFLKSKAASMTFVQEFQIDVISYLVSAFVLILYCIYRCSKPAYHIVKIFVECVTTFTNKA